MIEVFAFTTNDYYFSQDGKIKHCLFGYTYVVPDTTKLLLALTKAEKAGLCHTVRIRGRDVSKCLTTYFRGLGVS